MQWDIAGQDRFIGLLRNFYMNASAAIVVYDVTNPKTLENAAKWKADIDKKVRLEDGSPIPCILIGIVPNHKRRDKRFLAVQRQ